MSPWTVLLNPWMALGAVLALAGAAMGLYGWGYAHGTTAGAARVQKAWDVAKDRAEQEARLIRSAGLKQAEQYAVTVTALRDANAQTSQALQKSLRSKIACPSSGELGDIRLDADFVNSLFNVPAKERTTGN